MQLAKMAREHWEQWVPQKVADLKAEGEFEEAIQGAAALAQKEIQDLLRQGYQMHEAEEVALKQYILLEPEEGANLQDWEREEIAQMEEDYRKNVVPYLP